ncbi:endomucin isoform X1 [Cynocephalus volans]|uniref:endomucin isoform X1 n=1 Tax=Cynocephalus volans TaxID=110931 RepID=UPI002FC69833
MELLQVTIPFLLLSSFCSSETNPGVTNTFSVSPSSIPTTKTFVTTPNTTSLPILVTKATSETSPKGTANSKLLETSLTPTTPALTTAKGEELGTKTNGVMKNESITTNTTVTNLPPPNAVSTIQSPQNKTENQSSINTTKRLVNTLQPDASLTTSSTLPSISVTVPENNSKSQGTEVGKNASSSATSSSYSSVMLPVVIALIAITLSVFVLVGLYRMCWKTDPGMPENGNDQPQSDKEGVKLLTVKTISHESGEHSVQGKKKN